MQVLKEYHNTDKGKLLIRLQILDGTKAVGSVNITLNEPYHNKGTKLENLIKLIQ